MVINEDCVQGFEIEQDHETDFITRTHAKIYMWEMRCALESEHTIDIIKIPYPNFARTDDNIEYQRKFLQGCDIIISGMHVDICTIEINYYELINNITYEFRKEFEQIYLTSHIIEAQYGQFAGF